MVLGLFHTVFLDYKVREYNIWLKNYLRWLALCHAGPYPAFPTMLSAPRGWPVWIALSRLCSLDLNFADGGCTTKLEKRTRECFSPYYLLDLPWICQWPPSSYIFYQTVLHPRPPALSRFQQRFITISPSNLGVLMASHYHYFPACFSSTHGSPNLAHTSANGPIIILSSGKPLCITSASASLTITALKDIIRPLVSTWVRWGSWDIFWALLLVRCVPLNKAYRLSPLQCVHL